MKTSLIDLSHTVEHGMVTYKGHRGAFVGIGRTSGNRRPILCGAGESESLRDVPGKGVRAEPRNWRQPVMIVIARPLQMSGMQEHLGPGTKDRD